MLSVGNSEYQSLCGSSWKPSSKSGEVWYEVSGVSRSAELGVVKFVKAVDGGTEESHNKSFGETVVSCAAEALQTLSQSTDCVKLSMRAASSAS